MHSSRMRTVRNSSRLPGGYLVLRGVPGPGGCTWSWGVYLVPGVYLVWGCTWSQGGVPGLGGYSWSQGCTWSGRVPGPRGVYLVLGVYLVPGVYLVWACTWSQGGVPGPGGVPGRGLYLVQGYLPRYSPPPVNRMTDRCKNITFATSLRTVITSKLVNRK